MVVVEILSEIPQFQEKLPAVGVRLWCPAGFYAVLVEVVFSLF